MQDIRIGRPFSAPIRAHSKARRRWRWLIALSALAWSLGCDSDSPTEPNLLADFTFTGEGPVVEFTDQSSGAPTQWLWDFGDGATSTVSKPAHDYSETHAGTFPETFIVRLTVCASAGSGSDDCSSVEKPVRVDETGPPV